jgi:hypothetical protein
MLSLVELSPYLLSITETALISAAIGYVINQVPNMQPRYKWLSLPILAVLLLMSVYFTSMTLPETARSGNRSGLTDHQLASPVKALKVRSRVSITPKDGGTDSGVHLNRYDKIHLTADGAVLYGYEGGAEGDCEGDAITDANGRRTMANLSCGTKTDGDVPCPKAPVGSLIGRIGKGTWFFVGSDAVITADQSGELWLGHNDWSTDDNDGEYSVQIWRIFAPRHS